ncbi:MAG: sarcosine oxidase subunit gamma family protein [Sphingobium sp.]
MDKLSTSAFGRHLAALDASSGNGLTIAEWTKAGIAAVMAAPVRQDGVAERLASFAAGRRAHVLHSGPGQWLVIVEDAEEAWLEALTAALDGTAQVFDQSSGLGLLTLAGHHARMLLQKGVFVDLDKALDADGMSVSSVMAHISVTVWRLAAGRFGIAVPRSYAGSFWHWLEAAAAAEAIPLNHDR